MPIFAKSYIQGLSDEKLMEIISKPVTLAERIKFDAAQIVAQMHAKLDHEFFCGAAPNKLYGAYINEYGEAV